MEGRGRLVTLIRVTRASVDSEPVWQQWRRPLPTPRQRRHDVWSALAVLAGAEFTLLLVNSMGLLAFGDAPSLGEQLLLGAAVTAPLAVRRRYPLAVLAAVSALFIFVQARQIGDNLVPSIALFMAIYTVGAWERNRTAARWARIAVIVVMFCWLGFGILRLLLGSTHEEPPPAPGPLDPIVSAVLYDVVFNLVFFLSAYFFGEVGWLSARRRAELEHRAEQLRLSQEENTRGAIVAERVRIARDLHDVVAHHVSVMGIQAGAARRVLDTDPELARTALDTVERTARTAIDELRGLLGVLRAEPGSEESAGGADDTTHRLPRTGRPARTGGAHTVGRVGGHVRRLRRAVSRVGRCGADGLPGRAGGVDERGQTRRGPFGGRALALSRRGSRGGDHR